MAFIRLSDTYIDHPKFLALSASSFRLWHEGMAFCRKHQTDGMITYAELQGFRYYQPVRAKELATPYKPGANPLWHEVEGGYQVHDYLDWNESKADADAKRRAEKDRKRASRVLSAGCPPSVRPSVRADNRATSDRNPSGFLSQVKRDQDLQEENNEIFERAGRLREELYPAWYAQHRHGARLRLTANSLEFQDAVSLCKTWTDAELETLARIVLTTDDDFISKTDRGFKIFALKATWAHDRLKQVERAS